MRKHSEDYLKRKNEEYEGIIVLMQEKGISFYNAKCQYQAMHGKGKANKRILEIMKEYNCKYDKARYIYFKQARNQHYTERPNFCRGLTREEIEGYELEVAPNEPCGWKVKGKRKEYISVFKHWNIKNQYHWTLNICYKGTQRLIPLASLVYLYFHTELQAIEPGQVVHHKYSVDDNRLGSIEIISHGDNAKLENRASGRGSNQYTKKECIL